LIVRVALGPCTPQPSALPYFHVLTLYISLDNISAMDTRFVLHGITFVWDSNKASMNLRKHGIPFEQGAEAFFDPFLKLVGASRHEEARDAIIGMDMRWNLLFVVHIELGTMPSASSRLGRRRGGSGHTMKLEHLKKRLDRNRPMTTVSIRFPVDVIEDLKRVAPLRGFSGYQPLVRAYVGQGLRMDLERLENDTVAALVESLKRHGVSAEVVNAALDEVAHR
jgi:uncharacterized DUF497 family protein